jgi:predicted acetyltransferase
MPFVPAWDPLYLDSYFEALGEGFHVGNAAEPPFSRQASAAISDDREAWIGRIRSETEVVLPDGTRVEKAPSLDLWWVEDGAFVGAVEIRRELPNALYAAYAGHFSVGIRPSQRGRTTKRMLREALGEASKLGLPGMLVCCRVGNAAVLRWVRAYGIPIDEVPVPYAAGGDRLARFVIPLPPVFRSTEPDTSVGSHESGYLVADHAHPGGSPHVGRANQPDLENYAQVNGSPDEARLDHRRIIGKEGE